MASGLVIPSNRRACTRVSRVDADRSFSGSSWGLAGCSVSLSSDVVPEIREYERTSTTVVNVYVQPAYRRNGLARRLMVAILDWCRAQGIERIALHASNMGRPLYESLGFTATNEMVLYLK